MSGVTAGIASSRHASVPKASGARNKATVAKAASTHPGPLILNNQVLHSLEPSRLEIIQSMEHDGWVQNNLMGLLKPVEKSWQPNDFLPDPVGEDFLDVVESLRSRTSALPDDYMVTLVGDMITEEALPTYMTMLNTLDGVRDESGASPSPWAQWTRKWTAEENRHGDLLNKYLYLSGRVDMRAIEVTIQNLIGSGMDPKTENNPYLGFVYTSFQERATKISHGHTAIHAKEHGDDILSKICATIASDESRHEIAYTKIVDELFKRDPNGAMMAFADMMKKQIVMPAHLMDDLVHGPKNDGRNLFQDFSAVAQRLGVYTVSDYLSIMEHLISRWQVSSVEGLDGKGAEAQEYLMKLPSRVRRLAERSAARSSQKIKEDGSEIGKFSWVFDRPVQLL